MTNQTTRYDALTAADSGERLRAALRSGSQRDVTAAQALVSRLGHEPDLQVREMITWALVQLADQVTPQLVPLLEDEDPGVRAQAAHVLSKIKDPGHLAALAPLVADTDPQVAAKGFRAVASTGDERAADLLASRLGDDDQELQDALTRAFETLGERAVPVLVRALHNDRPAVREHAAEALGHLGSAADNAAGALGRATTDAEQAVRIAAVSSLGQLTGDEAHAALTDAGAASDPVVAAMATTMLTRREAAAAAV